MLALDAKVSLDDNALYRHRDLETYRDDRDETPGAVLAREKGLSYVKLDGDIGCIVNGAGLAMATMDLVKHYGGEPANFLDIGGSSNPEKMVTALQIITGDSHVRAILFNIFGGITRCDDVARGIAAGARPHADRSTAGHPPHRHQRGAGAADPRRARPLGHDVDGRGVRRGDRVAQEVPV